MAYFKHILPLAILLSCVSALALNGTAGCGKSHDTGYHTNNGGGFVVQSGGLNRTYTINIPSNYDPDNATGLIISYHGRGSTGNKQHSTTEFSKEDWNPDLISVYPNGVREAWQGANYANQSIDDLQFTSDLLAHLRDEYCIDNTRIYANGLSNGGGFVGTLACSEQGNEFAAFSACSGAFYTDNNSDTHSNCSLLRKPFVPFLEFHGSEDNVIDYSGGVADGGVVPAIPNFLARWSQRHVCLNRTVDSYFPDEYDGNVNVTTWSCAGLEDMVTGYWIEGMGHTWPGTPEEVEIKNTSGTVLYATPIIMDFFNKYTLTI